MDHLVVSSCFFFSFFNMFRPVKRHEDLFHIVSREMMLTNTICPSSNLQASGVHRHTSRKVRFFSSVVSTTTQSSPCACLTLVFNDVFEKHTIDAVVLQPKLFSRLWIPTSVQTLQSGCSGHGSRPCAWVACGSQAEATATASRKAQ